MLYDPNLVDAVYSDIPVAGLSPDGRHHLKQVDRRAWDTDPYRRSRTLQALIEELPVSAALAGIPQLDDFFSSTNFHQAVQQRKALVLAFADWLEPQVGPIAALERSIARARQHSPRTGPGLCMAVGVSAVSLPAGLLQWWQQANGSLGPNPLCALLENPPTLSTPPSGPATEHYLFERSAQGEIQVGGGSEALVALLQFADYPVSISRLSAEAVRLGAEKAEAINLIESLTEEGLLVQTTD